MLDDRRIGALLLMAGTGSRFGSTPPKQFLTLGGMPLYLHALAPFLRASFFDEILLVCPPEYLEQVRADTSAHSPLVHATVGGATRQASSYAGLQAFRELPDIVVIHDGVRPFVSDTILLANARGAIERGAVDTCIESADTLVHAPDACRIAAIPKRSEFFRGQTPQSFRYEWIMRAHRTALARGTQATDDCGLVLDLGLPVHIVRGAETNIKITSPTDLLVAEQIFALLPNI